MTCSGAPTPDAASSSAPGSGSPQRTAAVRCENARSLGIATWKATARSTRVSGSASRVRTPGRVHEVAAAEPLRRHTELPGLGRAERPGPELDRER